MSVERKRDTGVRTRTMLFNVVLMTFIFGGGAGCASESFGNFKRKLVSRSDEVVVTFYDSKTMNAATLKKLTEFSVDNREEVGRFRRFIRSLRSHDEDCRSDGKLKFVSDDQQLQQMEFNLKNRCITVLPDPAGPNKSAEVETKRLSRNGVTYLEQLQRRNTDSGSGPPPPEK